jgi:enterobacteria phage integrase
LGGFPVTKIRLRYINHFVDRTGRPRYYFRRSGRRVTLPGLPGSTEFMVAYQSALDGEPEAASARHRGADGTFDRLVEVYFASSDYARLVPSTRRAYRLAIERFIIEEKIGHRLVRQMTREHVSRIVARRADRPGAANDVLKKIRILLRFAIANGWRHDDPTVGIKSFAESEFHTWTDAEIAQFEVRWPVGTAEHMAFALLLYTGQRRSDVVRMSWRDIDGDIIRVTQKKTNTKLDIPLHPDLKSLLANWPKRHVLILTTTFGKPFAATGFGNWMADKIAAAGLPDECVTHGLRKAAARRLADAGCSTLMIMAR